MLDWWEGDFHEGEHWRVFILSLALRGRESRQAPEVSIADPFGGGSALHAGCVFHGADGRCSLHDRRLKPAEGRVAHHAMSQPTLHRDVAQHWDTDEGRRVVRDWCATHGLDDPYEEEEF